MANVMNSQKRAAIVRCLVEGNSIRATSRMTGACKEAITKLLVTLGDACLEYQDKTLRELTCKRIQTDELWAFCGCKCEKSITSLKLVTLTSTAIGIGQPSWRTVAHTCPLCHTIISAEIDPVAITNDTERFISKSLAKVVTELNHDLRQLEQVIRDLRR